MSTPRVDVVIPVYNGEAALAASVGTLLRFLDTLPESGIAVTIANNGSTDRTLEIARALASSDRRVRAFDVGIKGRGRALRQAWLESDAEILAYMDVDLSTDLGALPVVVAGLRSGFDLAVGSRLHRASRVTRCLKREVVSRAYNLLLRALFCPGFRDAQCGFKAIRNEAARALLPFVKNNHWFFDTELLLLAEAAGLRVLEVPVSWIENRDSRVRLAGTILEDLRGVARMRWALRRTARAVRQAEQGLHGVDSFR